MLHTSFNQDSTCFTSGTNNGFTIYNSDPVTERFNRGLKEVGSIGIIELLFRSNILVLVGGGEHPKYPDSKLVVWDDYQNACIAELDFTSPITGVKLRRDYVLVIINDKAFLYNFSDLELLHRYDTCNNQKGLCAMTPDDNLIIAVPGYEEGSVIVDHRISGLKKEIIAHTNPLSALTLSRNGEYLATASVRGTLIRVWDTKTGELVKELRRGLEVVTITSLVFDHDTTRLAVCSDKGTIHIFSLIDSTANQRSNLSYISGYLPSYFSSEWSCVTFEVPPNSICTFSNGNIDTLYVITPDSQYLKYTYNTKTGTGKCIARVDIGQ